jgi:hypothetical protein
MIGHRRPRTESSARRPVVGLLGISVFAIFPFVSFVNHNKALLYGEPTVFIAALAALVLSLAAAGAIKLASPRTEFVVIANAVAVGLLLFFNYGAFDLLLKQAGVVRHSHVLLLWSAATAAALAAVFHLRAGRGLSIFLLVAGAAALGLAGGELLLYRLSADAKAPLAAAATDRPSPADTPVARGSNVYFIVLDTYARADVLSEVAAFDNRPFLAALEKRGFYVAERSNSNYPVTTLSLSSTLNMDYLVTRTGRGAVGHHQRYNLALGGINGAVASFRRLGYRYVHVQSEGWRASWCLGAEDVCLKGDSFGALSETDVGMLRKTPLYPFFLLFFKDLVQYARFSLQDLAAAAPRVMSRPSFLFYHNLDVHGRQFDRQCRAVPRENLEFVATVEGQVDVLTHSLGCVNGQVLGLVDAILAFDPDAILIFQGDHGVRLGRWGKFEQWTERDLRHRFGILNAMRMPEPCRKFLYPSISPVNTFRVVFACLKGEEPVVLEDRSYWAALDEDRIELWRTTPR